MTIEGFENRSIPTRDGSSIFISHAGSGPPVLMLHGFPQTHLMWRDIAPALARDFSVVCADLRGYGASACPPSADDHEPYSKRAMAAEMVQVMRSLGHDRFTVVGHDRGGRVAYRMALDHPDVVARAAVLDVVPTGTVWATADARLALSFWPFSLLAQPAPLPERLIAAAPGAVIDDALSQWGTDADVFPPGARAAYVAALGDPASIHAICEEYRAAATIDRRHDDADRQAGMRIACPLLALWAEGGGLDTWYQDQGGPLGIWRQWAADVQGRSIAGGHFFPEAQPTVTREALRRFLGDAGAGGPACLELDQCSRTEGNGAR